MNNPTCSQCDCVAGCQARERLCPNVELSDVTFIDEGKKSVVRPVQQAVSDADVKAAMDGMHFTSTGIPRVIDMRCALEKFAKSRTIARPVCPQCDGTGVVSDGQITHSEGGVRYENGPVLCIKDCPACTAIAQPDMAVVFYKGVKEPRIVSWNAQPPGTYWLHATPQSKNIAQPVQPTPKITAYMTSHDEGDMLFFDKDEARRYCDDDSEPEPLVLLSDIAQPKAKT